MTDTEWLNDLATKLDTATRVHENGMNVIKISDALAHGLADRLRDIAADIEGD